MSQSTLATIGSHQRMGASSGLSVIDAEDEMQSLLTVIDDADCRAILEVTGGDSLSANELADECNIALSTVYRKLDRLTEEGLLTEGTRIRRSGKHTSEYSRCIEKIEVSVDSDRGFKLKVEQRDSAEWARGAPVIEGW